MCPVSIEAKCASEPVGTGNAQLAAPAAGGRDASMYLATFYWFFRRKLRILFFTAMVYAALC